MLGCSAHYTRDRTQNENLLLQLDGKSRVGQITSLLFLELGHGDFDSVLGRFRLQFLCFAVSSRVGICGSAGWQEDSEAGCPALGTAITSAGNSPVIFLHDALADPESQASPLG